MNMDFNIELFTYAFEKNTDNELWDVWKLKYPNMDKENFISFADFKIQSKAKPATKISYTDIEKEMEFVINSYERKGLKKN